MMSRNGQTIKFYKREFITNYKKKGGEGGPNGFQAV